MLAGWTLCTIDRAHSWPVSGDERGKVINRFIGQYAFLSNFYPTYIKLDGSIYPSVENAYQASKTINPKERYPFLDCKPNVSKKIGRLISIRPDWDNIRLVIMRELLDQKFHKKDMKELLLMTGDQELIEGNWWGDKFWGVCQGEGRNELGKMLMDIRKGLSMENTEEAKYGY